MDYVDLYQIHRWDDATPIEETMEALNDVVRAGKARYIGASSMYAWQFAKAQHVAEKNGWTKFVSMQNHYNLLYREEEREMIPLCLDQGVGLIPWSPLARGYLARSPEAAGTKRSETDRFGKNALRRDGRGGSSRHRGGGRHGEGQGPAARAGRPGVAAPEARRQRPHRRRHEDGALGNGRGRGRCHLSPEEVEVLEASYVPHAVAGHG